MKINYLLLTGFLISCFWSCEKEDINSSPSNSLVKTVNTAFPSYPGTSTTYTFDNQNRVKFILDNSGDSTAFEYFDKLIIEHRFSSTGVLNSSNFYYLNSQGLVDSVDLNNI